ncbi:adenylyl-sulfate kinase [Campylobacter aviculae]|uniref:Adenylyl-sulfate kinase n=1 Tax=Campylobacter aviculae TaxID=2510190 RepID=A0A4U7BFK3_9BACT|nr:adenylyl-sulfate kinase [Campylobacter aviculae]TKX28871.1 adenylyl-sulfate kinase [Campylobacter aviculae]
MQGALIFITGLSGSGKTTLASEIQKDLLEKYTIKSILLDGDELRACVGNLEYSKDARLAMARYYVNIAKILYHQGFIVLLSTISMFDEIRNFNRQNFKNYLEIFLDVSLDIRQKRDSKNFFKHNVQNMAGVDQALELPTSSDMILKDNFDINKSKTQIIEKILKMI